VSVDSKKLGKETSLVYFTLAVNGNRKWQQAFAQIFFSWGKTICEKELYSALF
jgi:hypothetical protein